MSSFASLSSAHASSSLSGSSPSQLPQAMELFALAAQMRDPDAPRSVWPLHGVKFITPQGHVGSACFDTGATATMVSKTFVERNGWHIRKLHSYKGPPLQVKLGDGRVTDAVGRVDVPMTFHLQVNVAKTEAEPPIYVSWHHQVTLTNVFVIDLGPDPPRDIFVSWQDFEFHQPDGRVPPLGALARLALEGVKFLDTPRPPPPHAKKSTVIVKRTSASPSLAALLAAEMSLPVSRPSDAPAVPGASDAASSSSTEESRIAALRRELEQLFERKAKDPRFAEKVAGNPSFVPRLIDALTKNGRHRVFGEIDPRECKECVEFELHGPWPEPVGLRVPFNRRVGEDAFAQLDDWERRGIIEKVTWDTKAFGFVFIVPKAGGGYRVTINPAAVNEATKRVDPKGGVMPANMVLEAQRVRGLRHACKLDMKEAFVTLKLGPKAQMLSTFVTHRGKYRWKHGWFGWHSFPAVFQQLIMTKVVLPVKDLVPMAQLLAWIDDLIVAAKTFDEFLAALEAVVDRILSFGGRLSLKKCDFLVDRFDWCGIEVDLPTDRWRIASHRVQDLKDTPIPKDRKQLAHVLGIIRYYYFGVADHNAQRDRLAVLQELDYDGCRVSREWTPRHTEALRGAMSAVAEGRWLMVFDPVKPVYVQTDASGNHGYSVTAHQVGDDGKFQPIFYYSQAWKGDQTKWGPQTKEAYAQMRAVAYFAPDTFPHADIVLMCDNKNLASDTESVDVRIQRWKELIRASGARREWIPGEWNTIADYGSRVVMPKPEAPLPPEEVIEQHLYGKFVGPVLLALAAEFGEEAPAPRQLLTQDSSLATPREFVEHLNAVILRSGKAVENAPKPESRRNHNLQGASEVTVVPGHGRVDALLARIADAQASVPEAERAEWTARGSHVTAVSMADKTLYLRNDKVVVPKSANRLKHEILEIAHDGNTHYCGGRRTAKVIEEQMKVTWVGLQQDADSYVKKCLRCALAKPISHGPSNSGPLIQTLAPYVHHTWYCDFKGHMPNGTGYLLVIREAISRAVKLIVVAKNDHKHVIPAFKEAIRSFMTAPVVLRVDNGAPFNSKEFQHFCSSVGIGLSLGLPEHHQGQGLVESLMHPLSNAILATMGNAAPSKWCNPDFIARLETVINSSYVSSIGCSPAKVLLGFEPRTPQTAVASWVENLEGYHPNASETDNSIENIVAHYHSLIESARARAHIASSVSQAVTKRDYDRTHPPLKIKVGDYFILSVHRANKLQLYYQGPYRVTKYESSRPHLVYGRHVLDGPEVSDRGPFAVARIQIVDVSRMNLTDVTAHQLAEGEAIIEAVLDHRADDDGDHEFLIKWLNSDIKTWVLYAYVKKATKVKQYMESHRIGGKAAKPVQPGRAAGKRVPKPKRFHE